jgi:hypothetical protein
MNPLERRDARNKRKRLLCRLIGHNWFGYPIYGYDLIQVIAYGRVCWRCEVVGEERAVPHQAESRAVTSSSSENVTIHWNMKEAC